MICSDMGFFPFFAFAFVDSVEIDEGALGCDAKTLPVRVELYASAVTERVPGHPHDASALASRYQNAGTIKYAVTIPILQPEERGPLSPR
ncbi:hypothetical protein [Sinorhizobium meliloti]|uniref:hypothetical protein n=1 Tax=Rhizobium meliloti TaxID=382 RepID=UPI0012969855|nr:hypothetical protein [Sinorhizobium meliloti]MQX90287.1 hypothetical protein [Sinorhizobium meliloti]